MRATVKHAQQQFFAETIFSWLRWSAIWPLYHCIFFLLVAPPAVMVLACGLVVVLWNLVFAGWISLRTRASLKQQRQAEHEAAAAAAASVHQFDAEASMQEASLDEQIAALAAPYKAALATTSNSLPARAA